MATMQGVQLFTDTDGNVAQLHGIGVQRFGDRWYAYGEIKNDGNLFSGRRLLFHHEFRGVEE